MAKEDIDGQQVVTMIASEGAPGVDADSYNPLSRAGRKRLEHGRGAREPLTIALLRDENGRATRWFGVFTESEGGQLIFFPGFATEHDRVKGEGAGYSEVALKPDHFSLSADLTATHITEREGRHQHVFPTLPLGDARVLWFGMTIPTFHSMRILRQETDAWAQIPKSLKAAHRRGQAFVDALNSAKKVTLTMPGAPPFPKSLLHFGVAVLPAGAPPYDREEIAYPSRWDGFVYPLPRNGKLIPRACGIVGVSRRLRLQLFTAWIPGTMRPDAVQFTVPKRFRVGDPFPQA